MSTKEDIVSALREVEDPEIHLDIYTLELVRNIHLEGTVATITMTFTSPMCPYGPMLIESIKIKVQELPGIEDVKVKIELNPPWKPSEELRALLGV